MITILLPRQKGACHTEAFRESAEFLFEMLRQKDIAVSINEEDVDYCFSDQSYYIVFGAHLFSQIKPACNQVLVNLEQLAHSPLATDAYISLLKSSLTIDYCESNLSSYSHGIDDPTCLGILSLCGEELAGRLHVSGLKKEYHLFYGSLTERRREILSSLEEKGIPVLIKTDIYASELGFWLQKARSVINIHAYDAESPFESIRLMPLIANSIPVLTENSVLDESTQWLLKHGLRFVDFMSVQAFELDDVYLNHAKTIASTLESENRKHVASDYLVPLINWCNTITSTSAVAVYPRPWSYKLSGLHLGCGHAHIPTMLNLDIQHTDATDIQIDICSDNPWPLRCKNDHFPQGLSVEQGSISSVFMKCVVEHLDNPVTAMANIRDVLCPGGVAYIQVPYDLAYGAWQDPTHRRAYNQNSFKYYYEWSWYLGWEDWGLKTHSIRPILSSKGREMFSEGSSLEELSETPRAIEALEVLLIKKLIPRQTSFPGTTKNQVKSGVSTVTQSYFKDYKSKPEHLIQTLFQDGLVPETSIPQWHQKLQSTPRSRWKDCLPSVSICTPTTPARHLYLMNCLLQILSQDYPLGKIEWTIVADRDDKLVAELSSLSSNPIHINVIRVPPETSIGRKRNIAYSASNGDLICNYDDDDFYFPNRIMDAVQLLAERKIVASSYVGSNQLPIYFADIKELWLSKPRPGVACAGSFLFPRELALTSHHDEYVSHGEEISFTRNYSLQLIDQEPTNCMVCFAHSSNTFDKSKLRRNGEREWIKYAGGVDDSGLSYLHENQYFQNLLLIDSGQMLHSTLLSQIEAEVTLASLKLAAGTGSLGRLLQFLG